MAKQLAFTDERGTTHDRSYWRPVQISFSPADKSASVLFYGYANAQARTDGKSPIAQKFYAIPRENYDAYYATAAIEGAGKGALKSAYAFAMATKDYDQNGNPVKTETLEENKKSFFEGATDV